MKNGKWLIAIIVLCFMIIMVPFRESKVLAAGNSSTYSKIRVRVEGVSSNLFDKEIPANANVTTSLDLLKAAVGADKVEGSTGQYGFFITGILGEKQGNNNSWGFYAQNPNSLETNTAVDKLNVKDASGNFIYNELVFYSSYYTATASTKIPTITVNSTGDNNEVSVKDLWLNTVIPNINVAILDTNNLATAVKNFTTDENGKIKFAAPQGTYNISFGKRGTYIEIAPVTYTVTLPAATVIPAGDNGSMDTIAADRKAIAKSTIDLNKVYYSAAQSLKFRSVLSLYQTSDNKVNDMASIASKFKVSQLEKATSYAGNIFALTALGKNPKNNDGVNYVQKLIQAQRADGMFIVENGDDVWPTTQAYSILALDMAGGEYNTQNAMKALISLAKNGHYDDIDTTAMVITALANHKDILGVNGIIESSLKYIKDNQLNSGGFEAFGAENPYSISVVIQALVANGIDVYSSDWTKSGNTMVDALLTYKFGNHFKYTASWGSDETMASEQAFAALADVYRGKSIYQTLKLNNVDGIKVATVNNVDNKNELPQTGFALDFSMLLAAGFIFIFAGAYVFTRKAKKLL